MSLDKTKITQEFLVLIGDEYTQNYVDTIVESSIEIITNLMRKDLEQAVIDQYKNNLELAALSIAFYRHMKFETLNSPSEITAGEIKIKNPQIITAQAEIKEALSLLKPLLIDEKFYFMSTWEDENEQVDG